MCIRDSRAPDVNEDDEALLDEEDLIELTRPEPADVEPPLTPPVARPAVKPEAKPQPKPRLKATKPDMALQPPELPPESAGLAEQLPLILSLIHI